jgi:hypothetical protein
MSSPVLVIVCQYAPAADDLPTDPTDLATALSLVLDRLGPLADLTVFPVHPADADDPTYPAEVWQAVRALLGAGPGSAPPPAAP